MAKVLVLYYSTWGHIETMAEAVAEGARSVPGAEVVIKRVPELMPEDIQKQVHVKTDQAAPIASPQELADYDAIIFGTPYPVRQHGRPDAQLPRPDRWPVGTRQTDWQGRERLHFHWHGRGQ